MTVGSRIRALRLQLGLTQGQLAGKEMTRSFISQVEAGKCNVSLMNLELIATRLGKPTAYFLSDYEAEDNVEVSLQACKQLLSGKRYGEALLLVERTLELSLLCSNPNYEGKARLLMGEIHYYMNNIELSMSNYQLAAELGFRTENKTLYVESLSGLGSCHYCNEEYNHAVRYYQRAVDLSLGLKTLSVTRIRSFIYMGSTSLRLGRPADSLQSYTSAVELLEFSKEPHLFVQCMLGKGWAEYQLGLLEEACRDTIEGLSVSKSNGNFMRVKLEHNYGIFQAARGNWEEALVIWNNCLKKYASTGDIVSQASIKEEIARYWMHRYEPTKARRLYMEALHLLDAKDNSVLRGRLFRSLAGIHYNEGNTARSIELHHLAIETFRRVKATAEMGETLRAVQIKFGGTEALTY